MQHPDAKTRSLPAALMAASAVALAATVMFWL